MQLIKLNEFKAQFLKTAQQLDNDSSLEGIRHFDELLKDTPQIGEFVELFYVNLCKEEKKKMLEQPEQSKEITSELPI